MKLESASSPKKPIYLVAESIGACIALSVAARNPVIDLVVILINPGYSRNLFASYSLLVVHLHQSPASVAVHFRQSTSYYKYAYTATANN